MTPPDRWIETPRGYVHVPPEACPACGWGWPAFGPGRPREGVMTCSCGTELRHALWTCSCGALVAEGCQDVTLWASATTPAGTTDDQRWAC